jgi:hypothetical protein
MAKSDEEYLDFLRYQEVPPERITKKDERWLSSRDARRELKNHRKEMRKRGK